MYGELVVNAINFIMAGSNRNRSRKGFSLIEVMCAISIMVLMTSVSLPSLVGIIAGNQLTNNAYALRDLIEQSRTYAITQHTYVWLGFSSSTQGGSASLVAANVAATSGLATDLQNGNYQLVTTRAVLKNVELTTAQNYESLPGLDKSENTDAASDNFSFTLTERGTPTTFSEVIAFGPDGEVSLPQSNGTLQLTQCVGLGLNAVPASAKSRTAAVQVHGLSGQISVFRE